MTPRKSIQHYTEFICIFLFVEIENRIQTNRPNTHNNKSKIGVAKRTNISVKSIGNGWFVYGSEFNFLVFALLLHWHNCFSFWRDVCVNLLFRLNTVPFLVRSCILCIVNFVMNENIAQRVCLKFCTANRISCSESLKI